MGFRRESRLLLLLLLLCIVIFSCSNNHVVVSVNGGGWAFNNEEDDFEIERQFKSLQYGGDIYDCVDFYKQPAFDHPLLTNHTMIQMAKSNSTAVEILGKFGITESCPTGTVPLRRTRKEELIASRNFTPRVHLEDSQEKLPSNPHVADIGVTADGHGFIGAQVLMDTFALPNIPPNGVSAGQVLLASGIGSPLGNSIHFGWIINPQLHGDNRPRLFTYWTSGNHGKKGCLNSECKGYVQVSSMLAPGMTIPVGKGSIKLSVHQDGETGNWLLVLEGQHPEVLGYFPKEIFNSMKSFGVVYCGGWAYGPTGTLSPPMGSGVFAGSPGACEFKQFGLMRVGSNDYLPPGPNTVKVYANLPDFYYVGSFENDGGADGYKFQFGGPGGYNETSDISGASEHVSGTKRLFCKFPNLDVLADTVAMGWIVFFFLQLFA